MAPLAARRADFAVQTALHVIAIELLLAAQAIDLRGISPAPALRGAYEAIRRRVPVMVHDRIIGDDIATIFELLSAGHLP